MTLDEIKNFFSTGAKEAAAELQPFLVDKAVESAKNAFGVRPTAISNTETKDEADNQHISPLEAGGEMSKKTKALIVAVLGVGGLVLIYKKFIKKAA